MLQEFKKFALKGNVLDLAVGVVVGAAFGRIVTSLVSDILMPPLGLVLGRVDFSDLYINLSENKFASLTEAKKAGVPTLNYGQFINTVFEFLIITFSVFLMIRAINRLKNRENLSPTTKTCPQCISIISVAAKKCAFCTSDL